MKTILCLLLLALSACAKPGQIDPPPAISDAQCWDLLKQTVVHHGWDGVDIDAPVVLHDGVEYTQTNSCRGIMRSYVPSI